jgi:hypothetical protein
MVIGSPEENLETFFKIGRICASNSAAKPSHSHSKFSNVLLVMPAVDKAAWTIIVRRGVPEAVTLKTVSTLEGWITAAP